MLSSNAYPLCILLLVQVSLATRMVYIVQIGVLIGQGNIGLQVCVCVCIVKSESYLCPTLCDLMDYIQSMEFSRPEYWSGQPFPSPGNLPNPGIKPRSPTLQTGYLPAEPQGKPMCICVLLLNFCILEIYIILQTNKLKVLRIYAFAAP